MQKALTLILEPLFESTFSNNSHGFRPQRSCHTALDQIRREWRSVSYFIEIDLAKCFDKLGHKLILESDDMFLFQTVNLTINQSGWHNNIL